jgi:dATP pyrophosphohydrolase
MMQYKQPVSVLVVIYTDDLDVLLLERADHPGYWQSVTGSRDGDELLANTAIREVGEETGLDARHRPLSDLRLSDWQEQTVYEIYPHWRYRYAPGVTHNTEHVFGLQLPHTVDIKIEPREHLNYRWLAWQDAAEMVFSPSNRAAILELPQRVQRKPQ